MIRASLLALRSDPAVSVATSTTIRRNHRSLVSLAAKRPRSGSFGGGASVATGSVHHLVGAGRAATRNASPLLALPSSSSSPVLVAPSPPSSSALMLQVRSYIFLPSTFSDVVRAIRSALSSESRRRRRVEVTLRLRATGDQVRERLLRYRNRALARYGGHYYKGRMRNLLSKMGKTGGSNRVLREETRLIRRDRRRGTTLRVLREEKKRASLLREALSAGPGAAGSMTTRQKLRHRLVGRLRAAAGRAKSKSSSFAGRVRAGRDRARATLVRAAAAASSRAPSLALSSSAYSSTAAARRMRSRLLSRLRPYLLLRNVPLYQRSVVTLDEPAHRSWFDADGFPLTSRDRITGRFVNPWNSESTNGHHSLADLWRWKSERWRRGVEEEAEAIDPSSSSSAMAPGGDDRSVAVADASVREASGVDEESILSPPTSDDRIKLSWLGHSTCLIRQHSFTFLTDPVFSDRAFPVQFMGPKRYAPPALSVSSLPNIDVCLISHDHYDHLDYGSVLDLVRSGKVKYWAVPLGIKAWLMNEAGVDGKDIVELEWWEGVRFTRHGATGEVEVKGLVREFPTSSGSAALRREEDSALGASAVGRNSGESTITPTDAKALVADEWSDVNDEGNSATDDRTEAVLTCAPAQHWCGRTPFDRNRRLWCSWAVRTTTVSATGAGKRPRPRSPRSALNFYFAGDTGLPPSFPLHRQIGDRLGPFDLSALPIGAYAPAFFMRDSHCDPSEAVSIHEDLRSRRSVAVHWGTFALADEGRDEPPRLLAEEASRSRGTGTGTGTTAVVDFVALRRGGSIESPGRDEDNEEESSERGVLGSLDDLAAFAALTGDSGDIDDEEKDDDRQEEMCASA